MSAPVLLYQLTVVPDTDELRPLSDAVLARILTPPASHTKNPVQYAIFSLLLMTKNLGTKGNAYPKAT